MARRLGDIPVVKCANRYEAGMYAINNLDPTPDLFVLDDGFQHRRLFRDKDILLVNSRDPFAGGKLFPVGLLREPLVQMKRADIIVITKKSGDNSRELEKTVRRYNADAPIFGSGYGLSSVMDASGEKRPIEWLKGKDVYAFCGIGEPGSFREALVRAGTQLRGFKAFGDHYRFTQGDMRKISNQAHVNGAPWIITTEKDIMRLQGIDTPENLLTLVIDFVAEERFFGEVFK
jgi:tetraacyldisaccharide 4'-kinase